MLSPNVLLRVGEKHSPLPLPPHTEGCPNYDTLVWRLGQVGRLRGRSHSL